MECKSQYDASGFVSLAKDFFEDHPNARAHATTAIGVGTQKVVESISGSGLAGTVAGGATRALCKNDKFMNAAAGIALASAVSIASPILVPALLLWSWLEDQ